MVTQETKPAGGLRRIGVRLRSALVLLGASVLNVARLHAQVPEPETVFYGRIVNRASGQEYLLTNGTLTWTVNGGAPGPITVTTQLSSLKGGKYSYVVKLPHQAKSTGLTVETGALPLNAGDADFESSSILINGQPARPLNAGSAGFVASQPRRGGAHRLDLEVFDSLEDSDNDGIPDWWEDRFGLDKNWAGDALLRRASNRFTYLEAFRLGLDPTVDDQVPELLTKEITVAAKASTGLLLRTVDSQSQPAQIRYRLLNHPAGSTIVLRNARPDPKLAHRELSIGDEFTQGDVNAGRVEYLHRDAAVDDAIIRVSIRNANPSISPITREVAVTVFQPEAVEGRAGELLAADPDTAKSARPPEGTAAELWKRRATDAFASEWIAGTHQRDRVAASLLAKWFDYTLWDGASELPARDLSVPSANLTSAQYRTQYLRHYGAARKHIILAGRGQVRISGGMGDDVLVGGEGHTIVKGNGGRDIFVAGRENLEVTDFRPAEGDVLDLSALLAGSTEPIAEKVQTTANATDTQLRIPLGTGSDAIVLLKNIKVTTADLGRLAARGNIFAGAPRSGSSPANHLPVAITDYGYVTGTESIVIPVLANDRDADGDVLSLSSVSNPGAGLAVISGNTVIYTPGPTFAGQDSFTYTVSDNRGGWASGTVEISYPFPAAAGTYLPLVVDDDGKPLGELRVQLSGTGSFTATLRAAGETYSGRGRFDANGFAEVILKAGRKLLTLQLAIDLSDSSYPMEGSIAGDLGSYSVLSEVALAKPGAKTSRQRHTVVLRAPEGDSAVAGHGFATLAIRSAQRGTVAGTLADGARFSAAVTVRADGTARWTAALYAGRGWLLGNLQLGSANPGSTRWNKSASSAGEPEFDRLLVTSHSLYQAPSVASVHALSFSDPALALAHFQMSGGFLGATALNGTLTFGIADIIKKQDLGGFTVQLRLNRATGIFAGAFESSGVSRPIRGAVLQNENRGFGHAGDDNASAVEIIAQ